MAHHGGVRPCQVGEVNGAQLCLRNWQGRLVDGFLALLAAMANDGNFDANTPLEVCR